MKKSLLILGVLAVGFANAQQYDGKVGVNTETPSATLNVKSKTGTDETTKNLELENAKGNKLLSVLDNGNVGIGYGNSTDKNTYALADKNIGQDDVEYNRFNIRFPGENKTILFQGSGNRVGTDNNYERMSSRIRFTWYDATADLGMVRGASGWIAGLGINFNNVEKVRFAHNGRVGIGTKAPTNTLHIIPSNAEDPLKLEGLQEATTGDIKNLVVVDGVVKIGSVTSSNANVKLGTGKSKPCNPDNAGTINYEEITREGKKTGVFGFCMKRNDNEYVWAYMIGGTNPFGTSANGADFADGIKD